MCSKSEWLSQEIRNQCYENTITSVSLSYIDSASHKIERILNEADIQVYYSSKTNCSDVFAHIRIMLTSFRNLVCIPCECDLVYIGEIGRNVSLRLQEHKTNCEKAELEKSAVAKLSWTNDHRKKKEMKR